MLVGGATITACVFKGREKERGRTRRRRTVEDKDVMDDRGERGRWKRENLQN